MFLRCVKTVFGKKPALFTSNQRKKHMSTTTTTTFLNKLRLQTFVNNTNIPNKSNFFPKQTDRGTLFQFGNKAFFQPYSTLCYFQNLKYINSKNCATSTKLFFTKKRLPYSNSNWFSFSTTKSPSYHLQGTRKAFLSPGFSNFKTITRNRTDGSGLKRTKGGLTERYILLMVYGSIAIGAVLLSTILFNQFQSLYKRFVNGIYSYYDPPFGRRQKLIKYKDVILPALLENKLEEIQKFTVRPDDVWVVSWPRSGTTWVQEIVYLITSDLNIELEKEKNLEQRFSFLENIYPGLKEIENSQSPRLIKSHLPFHLLPQQMETIQPKVIYVVRNPKDILISYYSFLKMLTPLKFQGTFDEFCDRFTKDKVYYSPWGKHVRDAWQLEKDGSNILIVKYEDLHKDLASNVERIASFLGKKLSDEQLIAICQRCQFESMKRNNSVNYSWWDEYGIRDKTQSQFLRKGRVGDWKHHITSFISRRIEKMVQDNLSDTDLVFDYELETGNLQEN